VTLLAMPPGMFYWEQTDTSINRARECHLVVLDLGRLEEYGLHTSRPEKSAL